MKFICVCTFVPKDGWNSGYVYILLSDEVLKYSCTAFNLLGSIHLLSHKYWRIIGTLSKQRLQPYTVVKVGGGTGQGSATEVTYLRLNQPPVSSSDILHA